MANTSTPAGPLLLFFEDEYDNAVRIAQAAHIEHALIERHRFPDQEIKLRLPPKLPEQLVILRSLDRPNEKLIELLLSAQTARSLGVRHLTLVAPYLAYMRQDIAFAPGEAISQTIVGNFLASLFDAIVTVDPHLHRVATLQEAVPVAAQHAYALSGAGPLSDWIATQRTNPLLIGPDAESAQWVSMAAARHKFEYAVCEKIRHGDKKVEITLPQASFAGRQVVLLDDVISSGHTVAQAAHQLRAAGASSIDVAVTHALFTEDAQHLMSNAGVGTIWSTDCIRHPSNTVSMSTHIAKILKSIASHQRRPPTRI